MTRGAVQIAHPDIFTWTRRFVDRGRRAPPLLFVDLYLVRRIFFGILFVLLVLCGQSLHGHAISRRLGERRLQPEDVLVCLDRARVIIEMRERIADIEVRLRRPEPGKGLERAGIIARQILRAALPHRIVETPRSARSRTILTSAGSSATNHSVLRTGEVCQPAQAGARAID